MANNQTVTSAPWGAQKPYLRDVFSQAQQQFQGEGPQFFPGQLTAGPTGAETQASAWTKDVATGAMSGQANQAGATSGWLLAGGAMDPNQNPYLRQTAEAAVAPLYQNLTERVLPQLRSESFSSGLVGSNRQGIAEGLAVDRTAQAAAAQTAGIYNTAYGTGLDAMGRALTVAPNTQAMQLAGPNALATAGGFDRGFEQAMIDEAIQRYTYNQNLPATKLAQYQNFIQGSYGGSTTAPEQAGGSPLMSGLGGAMMGAAAGAPFAGATMGLSIPIGALLGGGAGYYGAQ